jgi:outer membrane immunogenic protein
MRSKFWKSISALVAVIAGGSVAGAADLAVKAPVYKAPVVVPFSWTGFYIGIEGGGGWARESFDDNNPVGRTDDFRATGGIFGGQAGYRYQMGQLVLGVEGAGAWAHLTDTLSVTNAAGHTFSDTFTVRSLFSVTGQAGFALDRWLPYVKGGWAGATSHVFAENVAATASHSETNNGWTVGAGLDYAITNNIVLGVEFDHYDLPFGDFTAPASNGGTGLIVTNASRLTINAVLGRLNYKF